MAGMGSMRNLSCKRRRDFFSIGRFFLAMRIFLEDVFCLLNLI